jgi:transposase
VPKSIAVDHALTDDDAELLRDVELTILKAAPQHDENPLSLWQTVPGIGTILSLVLLDEIYDLGRFPRVQACASSGRLVTGAKASHGQRAGSSGTKMGHAQLQWTSSEAAVFCLRDHPAGPKRLVGFENKHGTGQALTI